MLPTPAKRELSPCQAAPARSRPRRRGSRGAPRARRRRCRRAGVAACCRKTRTRLGAAAAASGPVAQAVGDERRTSRRRRRRRAQASPQTARPAWRRTRRPPATAGRRAAGVGQSRATRRCRRPAPRRSRSGPTAPHGAQPVPAGAAGRVAVAQRPLDVGHAGAAVERDDLEARARRRASSGRTSSSPPPRVPHQVGGELGDDQGDLAAPRLVETPSRSGHGDAPPGGPLPISAGVLDRQDSVARLHELSAHFHRVMVTRVPSPGLRVDLELVDQPPGAAQAEAQAAAGWCSRR